MLVTCLGFRPLRLIFIEADVMSNNQWSAYNDHNRPLLCLFPIDG